MRSVRWLVRFCRPIAQSHMTFLMCVIYSANVFPSPIICINYFSHKSKPTSSERKFFLRSRDFFSETLHFQCLFLMRCFKMRIKKGDRNIATECLLGLHDKSQSILGKSCDIHACILSVKHGSGSWINTRFNCFHWFNVTNKHTNMTIYGLSEFFLL